VVVVVVAVDATEQAAQIWVVIEERYVLLLFTI